MGKKVVIVGAGPAGLTAALELQRMGIADITVVEKERVVGGISRTVNHRGNRIDIGGHRFFSKSDWVMRWWADILPLAETDSPDGFEFKYQGQSRTSLPVEASARAEDENVMLLRSRLSRIYYNSQFFDYPLKLNIDALRKLGLAKSSLFGLSYFYSKMFPRKPEQTLEDFFVNRFGRRLYQQFFKEYTEKVWGVACHEISSEWGAQRIKSLSVLSAVWHSLTSAFSKGKSQAKQTSLIESFVYPKFGPGQMWEVVAKKFVSQGGTLLMDSNVCSIQGDAKEVRSVTCETSGGKFLELPCTHMISTMPVKELVSAYENALSEPASDIAKGLQYRDFITVGLLYREADLPRELPDNWIYIQEPGVQVGRVQVFNNWSPYMVADSEMVWLGLEFFCNESDVLWSMSDQDLIEIGQSEMVKIGLISAEKSLDSVVIRVPKAYPGYFGDAYTNFDILRRELDSIDNLFLIGRNGMHRYNNQDHSMLTAKAAVEQIVAGEIDKDRIWSINVDDSYHEERSA